MDIIIDKKLQEFRRRKGNAQEKLPAFLAISPQAVSKRERANRYRRA